jgi:hypothetical protein
MSRRPNFFIVGAPKCGTTALATYLREHSQIFMTQQKEPHYFAGDYPIFREVWSEKQYLRLFRSADNSHLAVGEASVWYLYSENALPRIKAFSPDARIIVQVRNPVDLVYSYHSQALRALNEDEADFWTAWQLQAERRAGRHIPPTCRMPQLLQYAAHGQLGTKLEQLLTVFPKEQLHVVVFDDLVADSRRTYLDVLDFLGVSDDGRMMFKPVNEHMAVRSQRVARLVQRPPAVVRWAIKQRTRMGIRPMGILKQARLANWQTEQRAPMPAVVRQALIDQFSAEIDLLEQLLKRDLSRWREVDNS